jgi:hypothetical protein
MVPSQIKKEGVSFPKLFISKIKHGLILHSIRNKLAPIGIIISPYYWVQEGINHTEIPQIYGIISDYSVEFIEAEDLIKIEDKIRSYPIKSLLDNLRAGNKCLALKYKGEITSFLYLNFNKCNYALIDISLKSDEAYLNYMYTLETFRGRNLAPYLRYKSYEILKNMGRNKIYSISESFNSSAIKYKQKLNAKNLKLVLHIEIFKRFKRSFTLKTY